MPAIAILEAGTIQLRQSLSLSVSLAHSLSRCSYMLLDWNSGKRIKQEFHHNVPYLSSLAR